MKVCSLPVHAGPTTSEGAADCRAEHWRAQGGPRGMANHHQQHNKTTLRKANGKDSQELKPPPQPPESSRTATLREARETQRSDSTVRKASDGAHNESRDLPEPQLSTRKHIQPEPLLQNNRDDDPAPRGLVDVHISDTRESLQASEPENFAKQRTEATWHVRFVQL